MKRVDYLINVTELPKDLKEASMDKASSLYDISIIYSVLVDSNLLWRVWSVDEYAQVWVEVNLMNDQGQAEFHTIKVDEDTFEKIDFEEYSVLDV